MTLANYLTYALALAVAAAIPGPGVIAIVARALGSGFRPAFPMLLGLTLGDLVYLFVAVLGLSYIATGFATVFLIIKYAGAAYLLWMAWSFWTTGVTAEKIAAKQAQAPVKIFIAGLAVTLGNPKTIIFYMALLPTLFDLRTVTGGDMALLSMVTLIVLLIVLTPYIALAGRARILLQTPRALKKLNRFAAICLAGAATAIAFRTG